MLGRCTVCYGGVLCGRVVYCALGGVPCDRAAYCVIGWRPVR